MDGFKLQRRGVGVSAGHLHSSSPSHLIELTDLYSENGNLFKILTFSNYTLRVCNVLTAIAYANLLTHFHTETIRWSEFQHFASFQGRGKLDREEKEREPVRHHTSEKLIVRFFCRQKSTEHESRASMAGRLFTWPSRRLFPCTLAKASRTLTPKLDFLPARWRWRSIRASSSFIYLFYIVIEEEKQTRFWKYYLH